MKIIFYITHITAGFFLIFCTFFDFSFFPVNDKKVLIAIIISLTIINVLLMLFAFIQNKNIDLFNVNLLKKKLVKNEPLHVINFAFIIIFTIINHTFHISYAIHFVSVFVLNFIMNSIPPSKLSIEKSGAAPIVTFK